MINTRELRVGDWVVYTAPGVKEVGRVKSWASNVVWVVFNCNKNWDYYEGYTGQATRPQDLRYATEQEINEVRVANSFIIRR